VKDLLITMPKVETLQEFITKLLYATTGSLRGAKKNYLVGKTQITL
jgi:hypothetical protein